MSADSSHNPFGSQETFRPRFSLGMIFLLLVVNAGICILLLLATRVPMISDVVNDFWGLPKSSRGETDRTTHLVFLMACYAAPLAMTAAVSLAYSLAAKWMRAQSEADSDEDNPDSPFA
ncbi:hypothetical protein SH467x_000985 [Pirellulaceae bacterium SH467]